MKINQIVEKEFYNKWQKELKKLSAEVVKRHFKQNTPVYEQIENTIYQLLPSGEKNIVKENIESASAHLKSAKDE